LQKPLERDNSATRNNFHVESAMQRGAWAQRGQLPTGVFKQLDWPG
jgi:hypothetical protein